MDEGHIRDRAQPRVLRAEPSATAQCQGIRTHFDPRPRGHFHWDSWAVISAGRVASAARLVLRETTIEAPISQNGSST